MSPLLAHRDISLRCRIWSLSGHSGHRVSRTNQARFMSTRPRSDSTPFTVQRLWPLQGPRHFRPRQFRAALGLNIHPGLLHLSAASISRSTSRSVRYSRLPLPTVTFIELGAAARSHEFSMETALPPVRTVTDSPSRTALGIGTPRRSWSLTATALGPRSWWHCVGTTSTSPLGACM
jgi:hypothetical protein